MRKKRTTITHVQYYTLVTAIKQKYGEIAPDKYVKYIAADLSQELGFPVSPYTVTSAFDYQNIPRKGHRGKPSRSASIIDQRIDLLSKQIVELENKVTTLEVAT